MKHLITRFTLLAGLASFASYGFAEHYTQSQHGDSDPQDGFYVWADVVDAEPVMSTRYEQVPVEHCRVVYERPKRDRRDSRDTRNRDGSDVLPTLFGGLIGGVIGKQFGDGNGQRAMTVVGAMAGASIAQAAHRKQRESEWHRADYRDEPRKRRICETSYDYEEVQDLEGYHVTYRYLGREFTRMTDQHPGDRLRIHVSVEPVLAVEPGDVYAWSGQNHSYTGQRSNRSLHKHHAKFKTHPGKRVGQRRTI